MGGSLRSTLPNLGIGVVAVLALAYITREFLKHLDIRAKAFEVLNKEVRDDIMKQLFENTRLMERVVTHMDKH